MQVYKKPIPWHLYKFHKLETVKVEERWEEYGPTNFKTPAKVMIVTKRWRCTNVQDMLEAVERCESTEDDGCELLLDIEEEIYEDSDPANNECAVASYEETDNELKEAFQRFMK